VSAAAALGGLESALGATLLPGTSAGDCGPGVDVEELLKLHRFIFFPLITRSEDLSDSSASLSGPESESSWVKSSVVVPGGSGVTPTLPRWGLAMGDEASEDSA